MLTRSDGSTVTFKPLGTNALCVLEERLGLTFGELMAGAGVTSTDRWSLRVTRELLLAACETADVSLESIGDLIDHVGLDAMSAVINAIVLPALEREVRG